MVCLSISNMDFITSHGCTVKNMLQLKEVQSTLHEECILCTVHVHKSQEYAV